MKCNLNPVIILLIMIAAIAALVILSLPKSQGVHLAGVPLGREKPELCLPNGGCESDVKKCAGGICLNKRDLPCSFDNLLGFCGEDQKCGSYGICISTNQKCSETHPCKYGKVCTNGRCACPQPSWWLEIPDADIVGTDVDGRPFPVDDVDECREACRATVDCVSAVTEKIPSGPQEGKQWCWLKSEVRGLATYADINRITLLQLMPSQCQNPDAIWITKFGVNLLGEDVAPPTKVTSVKQCRDKCMQTKDCLAAVTDGSLSGTLDCYLKMGAEQLVPSPSHTLSISV